MKILWHSVPARYNTGYGCQTRIWTRALKDAGHDVVVSAVAGSMPTYPDENGITTLSQGTRANMGNDFIQAHCKEVQPDILLSMMDTFVIDVRKFKELPWYGWVVVDSSPLMTRLLSPCKAAKGNLAMSRFGQETLKKAGVESTYIPLAIRREEFYPVDRMSARKCIGAAIGLDLAQKFVVMMNSANMSQPSRKNFGCAFKAFAEFLKTNPDAFLYVHSERTGQMARGEDLDKLAKMYGIEGHMAFAHQYAYNMGMIGDDFMRSMYNTADVFLHTALGEGFGLPLIEAQACGCPVIAPEYSASGELVENGLKLTKGVMHMMWDCSEQFIADYRGAVSALVEMRERIKADPCYGMRPSHCQQYYIDHVMERCFNPWLETIKKGLTKHEAEKAEQDAGSVGRDHALSQGAVTERYQETLP